jgi:hypothetical protein
MGYDEELRARRDVEGKLPFQTAVAVDRWVSGAGRQFGVL